MRTFLSVVTLCLLTAAASVAQETRGNISGTVQDAQGVVPGATVRITNVDTNTTQVLVTNSTGYSAAFQKRQFPFRVDGVRGQALSF